jgi:hypothetical protein
MTDSNRSTAQVERLIALEPPAEADQANLVGWLQRLCRAAARALPASGVGVSMLSNRGDQISAASSGGKSALIEELQFITGEGPCLEAFASRRPVLTADLAEAGRTRWPGYAPAAHAHGVRAVFAFPLALDDRSLGALDVYRDRIGALSADEQARALGFADVAVRRLLDAQEQADATTSVLEEAQDARLEVYQAQGMVMVQLRVGIAEATSRIRAYAYAHDRRLGAVAGDIVARRLSFQPEAP